VLQATRNGHFFVLDRVTGEHLLTTRYTPRPVPRATCSSPPTRGITWWRLILSTESRSGIRD
jgi:glucose dehydrogenase